MAIGDPMIDPVQQAQTIAMPSALPPVQPKQPGKFSRIFGGILGGALNLVAPGAGSLVGNFIGGGSISSNMSYMNMQQMLEQSAAQQMQMIAIQNKVQTQTQEFTTVSNLLKARHDGEMSAVHNFKS